MYTDPKIQESIRKVEAARAENVKLSPARMSAEEKENLLKTFHPDYRENQFTTLRIGPNKGSKVPLELAALLEGKPRVELSHPQVAMLARRLNGKYIAPHCEHLDERVQEIRDGKFEALIENLMEKPLDEIKELYNHREIEA